MIAFEKAGNELSASVGETSSWKTSYKLSRDDRLSLTSRTRGKQVPGSALAEDVMSAKLWKRGTSILKRKELLDLGVPRMIEMRRRHWEIFASCYAFRTCLSLTRGCHNVCCPPRLVDNSPSDSNASRLSYPWICNYTTPRGTTASFVALSGPSEPRTLDVADKRECRLLTISNLVIFCSYA